MLHEPCYFRIVLRLRSVEGSCQVQTTARISALKDQYIFYRERTTFISQFFRKSFASWASITLFFDRNFRITWASRGAMTLVYFAKEAVKCWAERRCVCLHVKRSLDFLLNNLKQERKIQFKTERLHVCHIIKLINMNSI